MKHHIMCLNQMTHLVLQMSFIFQETPIAIIKNELADMEISSTIHHLEPMDINVHHVCDSEKRQVNPRIELTITFRVTQ